MTTAKPGQTLRLRFWGNGHSDYWIGYPVNRDPGVVRVYWGGRKERELKSKSDLVEANWIPGAQGNFSGDAIIQYNGNTMNEKGNYFSLTLPTNMANGRHAMVWAWAWDRAVGADGTSSGSGYNNQFINSYSTCFDIQIEGSTFTGKIPCTPVRYEFILLILLFLQRTLTLHPRLPLRHSQTRFARRAPASREARQPTHARGPAVPLAGTPKLMAGMTATTTELVESVPSAEPMTARPTLKRGGHCALSAPSLRSPRWRPWNFFVVSQTPRLLAGSVLSFSSICIFFLLSLLSSPSLFQTKRSYHHKLACTSSLPANFYGKDLGIYGGFIFLAVYPFFPCPFFTSFFFLLRDRHACCKMDTLSVGIRGNESDD